MKKAVDSAAGIGFLDLRRESRERLEHMSTSVNKTKQKNVRKTISPFQNELGPKKSNKTGFKKLDEDVILMDKMKNAIASES